MAAIPEFTRSSVALRLLDHAEKHWPDPASLHWTGGLAQPAGPAVKTMVAYLHRPGIATGPVYCGLTGSVPALGRA